eukprot:scpid32810/ scgid32594/ 
MAEHVLAQDALHRLHSFLYSLRSGANLTDQPSSLKNTSKEGKVQCQRKNSNPMIENYAGSTSTVLCATAISRSGTKVNCPSSSSTVRLFSKHHEIAALGTMS